MNEWAVMMLPWAFILGAVANSAIEWAMQRMLGHRCELCRSQARYRYVATTTSKDGDVVRGIWLCEDHMEEELLSLIEHADDGEVESQDNSDEQYLW